MKNMSNCGGMSLRWCFETLLRKDSIDDKIIDIPDWPTFTKMLEIEI